MTQTTHGVTETPAAHIKSVLTDASDQAGPECRDAGAGAAFVAGAVLHDVVGDWLLRLAQCSR